MSRLQTITNRTSERFSGKYYYCEMSSKTKYSDWPCETGGVDQLIDCDTCPLNAKQNYKTLLESLCLESPQ